MLFYQGFAVSIVAVASPWIGTSFHLDGAGIARLFAWISLSALGALALSRMIDRYGRRRMILWCMAAIPICSIGTAVSTKLIWFAAFQIGLYAVVGAAGSGCVVMLSEELPIARARTRPELRRPGQQRGSRTLRLLHADLRCVRMVVAMDVRNLGVGHRDAPGDGAVAARERAMGAVGRVGITQRTRFYDVFQPLYRKRSITIIVCAFAAAISTTAANAFGYYHAVSVVGMSAAAPAR